MKKYFNTEGRCRPDQHYMVNLDKRLSEIKKMVDRGDYFVINRGRQYGKTTTLFALAEYLRKDYVVVHLDFQFIDSDLFKTGESFCNAFADILTDALLRSGEDQYLDKKLLNNLSTKGSFTDLKDLFKCLSNLCKTAQKPIVLMIDEVDQASNNQVFLNLLSQLRGYYFGDDRQATFQSVILAGVYDIKSLRDKYTREGGHKMNSPWNIAAKFKVDMDFSTEDIESMLKEYEADTHTGMNIPKIAQLIYNYTSGYPVLVSSICKELDEEIAGTKAFPTLSDAWTETGVLEAIKIIVTTSASVFDSMIKQISEHSELKEMLRAILFQGEALEYNGDDFLIHLGTMFGYIRNDNGKLKIANRIFETRLYNLFLFEDKKKSRCCKAAYISAERDKPLFIKNGKLDMELVLEKFVEYFKSTENAAANKKGFLENQGRRMFLLYLRPIINGAGNYFVEAKTRSLRRMDLLVIYAGVLFIIEMKIWRGEEYNEAGEKQIGDYMKELNLDTGYMLTFSFLKDKEVGVKKSIVDGKTIVEATV